MSASLYADATYVAENTIDSDLPPLQFPDDDFWNVYVTVANSTIEIWIRIIGDQYSVSLHTFISFLKIDYYLILNYNFIKTWLYQSSERSELRS